MVIKDDLPDKGKIHKALRDPTFNIFHMNGKTHISSSVYSEVTQIGSVGFSVTVLAY